MNLSTHVYADKEVPHFTWTQFYMRERHYLRPRHMSVKNFWKANNTFWFVFQNVNENHFPMPESLWVSDNLHFHNKDEFALMNIFTF